MRWTDLPADRGSADAAASALARGEWDDLRRRLEQLPAGHPSRMDADDRADEETETAGESLAREAAGRAGGGADQPGGGPSPDPERGRAGHHGDSRERDAREEDRGGRAGSGGRGDLGGPVSREPYRPWFTAGESPQPWFAEDPG
jgi:hypothetical protein